MRQQALGFIGWLCATLIATAVGIGAVSLLSERLTSDAMIPLSSDAVAKALASAGPGASTPTSGPSPDTPTAPTATTGPSRSLSSPGGTVIARCEGDLAYLMSWSPAQGWSVDEQQRGPASSTMIQFEGDTNRNDDLEVTLTVTCRSGSPVSAVATAKD